MQYTNVLIVIHCNCCSVISYSWLVCTITPSHALCCSCQLFKCWPAVHTIALYFTLSFIVVQLLKYGPVDCITLALYLMQIVICCCSCQLLKCWPAVHTSTLSHIVVQLLECWPVHNSHSLLGIIFITRTKIIINVIHVIDQIHGLHAHH